MYHIKVSKYQNISVWHGHLQFTVSSEEIENYNTRTYPFYENNAKDDWSELTDDDQDLKVWGWQLAIWPALAQKIVSESKIKKIIIKYKKERDSNRK